MHNSLIDLTGADLSNLDLSGANLSKVYIQGTNFTEAKLRGTNFSEAKAGLRRGSAIILFLCYLSFGLFCLSVAMMMLIIAPAITIKGLRIDFAVWIILGSILFLGSVMGIVLFGSVLTLINQGKIKQRESIFSTSIVLIVFTITVLAALLIDAVQGLIKTTQVIEGVVLISITFILAYFIWSFLKEQKLLKDDWIESQAISLVSKGDTSFRNADLTDAIFSKAIIRGADFRGANLSNVSWLEAQFFDRVLPGDSYLQYPQVRELVTTGNIENQQPFKNKNLRGINLEDAILTETSFAGADLSNANLQNADLSKANFFETKLKEVNLTGATIEDCNINSNPNLDSVICDYVYLKQYQQERRPAEGKFYSREFAKLIETSRATVDLVFSDGIDWKAFLLSFQGLLNRYGEQNISLQGIQKKSGGAFVISLDVSPTIDEKEIETKAYKIYEGELKVIEAKYRKKLKRLKDKQKDRIIHLQRKHNTNLNNIVYILAKMANQESSKYDFRGANIGGIIDTAEDGSNQEINQFNYSSETEQILIQTLEDIQKLIKQFEQNNPDASEEEKIFYVNDNTTPSFKRRVRLALQGAGETALEEFLDNSYVNIGKAAIKGWLNPE